MTRLEISPDIGYTRPVRSDVISTRPVRSDVSYTRPVRFDIGSTRPAGSMLVSRQPVAVENILPSYDDPDLMTQHVEDIIKPYQVYYAIGKRNKNMFGRII